MKTQAPRENYLFLCLDYIMDGQLCKKMIGPNVYRLKRDAPERPWTVFSV